MFFFFSKISDVRYITSINGHNALLTCIDDLIYCALPSKIQEAYQFLLALIELNLQLYYVNTSYPMDNC